MTTQYERDMMIRARERRRLLALVEAAHDVLDVWEDGGAYRQALLKALDEYDLQQLRQDVAYYNAQDARRADEEAAKERARNFAESELPDARPRRQCEAERRVLHRPSGQGDGSAQHRPQVPGLEFLLKGVVEF